MTLRYLLDTNVISKLASDPDSPMWDRLAERAGEVCTSVIVRCEIAYGFAKGIPQQRKDRVELVLSSLPILPVGEEVAGHYGDLRTGLQARGELIGANDMFIAAHALSESLTIVTNNTREFARVPNLRVEDWSAT